MSRIRSAKISFYTVIFLFAIYLINGIIAIPKNSVVYDEMDHWSYGKRILMRKPEKIFPFDDASAMPITGINALPRAVEQVMSPGLLKTDGGFSDIMHGRYVTLIICLLTGFFIYRWSKDLFGEKAALLSLFFFVFCPNLNGNSIILSTDAYTALITVSTAYYFWKFVKKSGWKNFLYFCISLGLAQIVKYSMIHLFIIFGLASLFVLIKRRTIFNSKNITRLVVMGMIVLFIINIGYLFNNTGRSLQDLKLSSRQLSSLQNSFVGKIPLPFPGPYIEGIDLTTYMNEVGAGDPNVSDANYIFGEKRTVTGFWYYYLGMLAFKTPLSILLILIGAILFLFFRKPKQGHPSTMLFLLFFIFYFLLVLGFQSNVQIGVRHVLMIYPLLYVLAGFIVTLPWYQARQKIVAPILVIYSLATYYFFFPNLLSYSNELIIDKKNAYKVMADSNLDYGQGVYALEKYLKAHPDVSVAPRTPAQGKFVISINDYLNLKGNNDYSWIGNYKPVAQIDHCVLLVYVTAPDIK